MRSRVVITGMGICSAIGSDPAEVAARLVEGRGGVRPISSFDSEGLLARMAAEVPDFDPYEHFEAEDVRRWDRATQMAVWASGRALAQAGLPGGPGFDRVGVSVGVSGAGQYQTNRFTLAGGQVDGPIASSYFVRNVPNYQAEQVAGVHGLRGPRQTFSSASAGSGVAVAWAMTLLDSGKADAVLAGGSEGLPLINVVGMESLGILSPVPCSPFSDEPGMTLGEGAAFFVLEPLERAEARGAVILGELLGFGVTLDGYDPITNDPSGEGMARAMRRSLVDSGIGPGEVEWIRASGTSNRDQDVAETLAIKQVFGTATPVSSLEPFFGHANGASPAMGLLAAVVAQDSGVIPPTLNFGEARPGCDLDYVPNRARHLPYRSFLAHSAAFGGINVALVGGRADATRATRPARRDDVVITGIGVVSPLGSGTEAFVEGLRAGDSGIAPLDLFDSSRCRSRHAGCVREFRPRRLAPSLDLRRSERLNQFAAVAASLACEDSGLRPGALEPDRVGVVTALAHGPGLAYERFFDELCRGEASPSVGRQLLKIGRFLVASQVGHLLQLKGYSATIAEGVGGGLHALTHAFELLRQSDACDAAVVVAADELSPLFFRLIDNLGSLSTAPPPLQPYDAEAPGMLLGEGAVALVLERATHARSRGAQVHSRILGTGLTSEAIGGDGPRDESALLGAMGRSLTESGIGPGDIDLIYGHGRGLPGYDLVEARAFARLLGGRRVPACCVNPGTGVAEATSGLYGIAAASLGLARGEAYPVSGPRGRADASSGLDLVRGSPRGGRFARALVAGGTDSGNNAAVVLGVADEGGVR